MYQLQVITQFTGVQLVTMVLKISSMTLMEPQAHHIAQYMKIAKSPIQPIPMSLDAKMYLVLIMITRQILPERFTSLYKTKLYQATHQFKKI